MSALLMLCLAGLASAAPSRMFDGGPEEVLAAFKRGDAIVFVKAAQRAEYVPPASDDAQWRLYDEGLERQAAELHYAKASDFSRQLQRYPGLRAGVFQDCEEKREILRNFGYATLNGKGGRPIPISEAPAKMVGSVFSRTQQRFEHFTSLFRRR